MPLSRCSASLRMWPDPVSADFEYVAELSLAARRLLAALLRRLTLLLADEGESGAKVFVLDDRRLRHLTQFVESGVRQVEPAIADRQPAVGIVDDRDALAAQLAGDLVRLE